MCGVTRLADARAAVMAGTDLIGLNFYPGSPRAVSFGLGARLSEVARSTPQPQGCRGAVRTVAVLVDAEIEFVRDVIEHVAPDILQFHGDEAPGYCQHFRKPFLKAFRLEGPADVERISTYLGGYAVGYLIDAWAEQAHGGTGRRIGRPMATQALAVGKRGFLAGGLDPSNVADAVRTLRPYGVDVASGIELRPGVKGPDLMAAFVRQVELGCRG